jgi:hypothetical protein
MTQTLTYGGELRIGSFSTPTGSVSTANRTSAAPARPKNAPLPPPSLLFASPLLGRGPGVEGPPPPRAPNPPEPLFAAASRRNSRHCHDPA